MDRNKRIAGFVFAGIIALAITACKVQQPGYVGLYIDNSISVSDTIDPVEGPLSMPDTTMTQVVDKTAGIEAEWTDSLRPSEELFKISSDTAYQHVVNELLQAITDSIQLLRHQINLLQNQHVIKPDTNFPGKIIHKVQQLDSLQPEFEWKQQIQVKNDTIAMLRNQVTVLNKSAGLKADTVYITKEIVKLLKGDSLQADDETTQLLRTKNDAIAFLRKQVHELENNGSIKTDTIYVIKETAKLPGDDSRQTDLMTFQLIKAKDEQIQMLQNQLNAMQTATAMTPQHTQITMEPPAQTGLLGSQKTDHLTLQLLQAKNDTIFFLRTQLYNLRLQSTAKDTVIMETGGKDMQPLIDTVIVGNEGKVMQPAKDTVIVGNESKVMQPAKDTVIVENESKDMQLAKEPVSEQETSDFFQASQDTLQLLKVPVPSLEEQIIPGIDTTVLSNMDKKDVPSPAITDTILLVAYYEQGEIKPLEEESILKQIKEFCSSKNVTKIELSGYTDSSGNELINKEITNTRLNYLFEKIIPWIAKEKVFFQNFGDAFASDRAVINERRIEIRIHTKLKTG
ncbi:MAG: hypothetical protein JXP36_10795 [Bacteroidales bacterium]|nr:hypothetical protein [Bacteroidales bacterium]